MESHHRRCVLPCRNHQRWGTGTLSILDWCAENANPAPAWAEQAGSVVLTFAPQTTEQVEDQVKAQEAQIAGEVTGEVQRLLEALVNSPMTRIEAQKSLDLKGQANFRDRYLQPALSTKLIEMTIPDKPRSSKQRYRLTEKGRNGWIVIGKGFGEHAAPQVSRLAPG